MGYVRKYQIPAHDDMPSDEMIEWLHGLDQEWDGDESGITVLIGEENGEQKWEIGAPGDWLIQDEATGFVTVATEKQLEEMGL